MNENNPHREDDLKAIEEIQKPWLDFIKNTPEATSLLYDIDLLPEQQQHTGLVVNAARMAAVCFLMKDRNELADTLVKGVKELIYTDD